MKYKTIAGWLARGSIACLILRTLLLVTVIFDTTSENLSHGWLNVLYSLLGAIAYGLVYLILYKQMRSVPAHVGRKLVLLGSAGLLAAAFFTAGRGTNLFSDWQAAVHNTGEIITLLAIPVAAMLINLGLALRNSEWQKWDDGLLWTSFVPVIGLIVLFGYLYTVYTYHSLHVDSKILRHFFPVSAIFVLYDGWAVVLAWLFTQQLKTS